MVEFLCHCATCIWRHCKISECTLVDCKYGCGVVTYHRIGELCPNRIVTCINLHYGYKKLLLQCKIKSHLAHCPASVVRCKFAWEHVDCNILTSNSTSVPHHETHSLMPVNNGENFAERFLKSNLERIIDSLEPKEKGKEFSTMVKPSSSYLAYPEEPYSQYCRHGDHFPKMTFISSPSPSSCCFYITTKFTHCLQLRVLMQCEKLWDVMNSNKM